MLGITDIIEKFILLNMGETDKLSISRNQLADHFSCAPSQINYVLTTRFTLDKGYVTVSKRGGNGYITITRIKMGQNYLQEVIGELVGNFLTINRATQILTRLCHEGVISGREQKLILSSISDRAIFVLNETRDYVRASIFKSILSQLLIMDKEDSL